MYAARATPAKQREENRFALVFGMVPDRNGAAVPQPRLAREGGIPRFAHLGFGDFILQPMDGPEAAANTEAAVRYCMGNRRWRLGLQTHKFLGIA